MQRHPFSTTAQLVAATGLSDPTVNATLADLTRLVYGQAAVVDIRQDGLDPVFRKWAGKFGLKHLMRTCALDTRFGLIGFLSVYRLDPRRPFSAEEIATMETLIPHLAAAMRINRTMQLFRLGKEVATETRRAICDTYGVIHRADHGKNLVRDLPLVQDEHMRVRPCQPLYLGQPGTDDAEAGGQVLEALQRPHAARVFVQRVGNEAHRAAPATSARSGGLSTPR